MTNTVRHPLYYKTNGALGTMRGCKELMDSCRDPSVGKPIGNNTRLYHDDDHYYVELHGNRIMEIHPKHWVLYDGGWKTVTTKMRLNRYTPSSIVVYSKQGVWYVENNFHIVEKITKDKEFYDGMIIPHTTLSKLLIE